MTRLVLASQSAYRRTLLERLGLAFETDAAHIDETAAADETPPALARRLAREKAERVAQRHRDAFVIGSDQVIALDDQIFNKPGSEERAVEQLLRLQGRTHELITAVAVAAPDGEIHEDLVAFRMKMRALDRQEAERYVREDEPLACAGSYKIEEAGIRLFESIAGDDYTAIIGLPLTRVWTLLQRAGYFDA